MPQRDPGAPNQLQSATHGLNIAGQSVEPFNPQKLLTGDAESAKIWQFWPDIVNFWPKNLILGCL